MVCGRGFSRWFRHALRRLRELIKAVAALANPDNQAALPKLKQVPFRSPIDAASTQFSNEADSKS